MPDVRGDVSCLAIRSGSVDAVVCLEVLEYVWAPLAALAEVSRALIPGGILVISSPFLHRVDAPDDFWRLTEPGLRRLLAEAGFKVLRWRAQGHALAVVTNVLRYVVSLQAVWVQRVLRVMLRPLFATLLWADRCLTRRWPILASFTTGYLVVARKPTARESG